MLTQRTIKEIANRLANKTHPNKIILFGSYARKTASEDSDLDILVIAPKLTNKGLEMVRLRNIIGRVGIGVDVMVYSQKEANERGKFPGTALNSALKEGKVLYESKTS